MIEVILKLYPQIAVIRGETAYDADGNEVAYDKAAVQAYVDAHAYIAKRASEYPPITDYIDGVVKGDKHRLINTLLTAWRSKLSIKRE
jgi:hypothetical protein